MSRAFLARLDDLARLTGVPALAGHDVRRRRVRLPATGALVLGYGCLGWSLFASGPSHWLSYGLGMVPFMIAIIMQFVGPVKPWGGTQPLDERERTIRSRAYLAAFGLLAATAYLALFLMGVLALMLRWPVDRLAMLLFQLGFLLITIYGAGPACFASWAEPAMMDEE